MVAAPLSGQVVDPKMCGIATQTDAVIKQHACWVSEMQLTQKETLQVEAVSPGLQGIISSTQASRTVFCLMFAASNSCTVVVVVGNLALSAYRLVTHRGKTSFSVWQD